MKHRHNRLAVALTLAGAIAMAPVFAAATERTLGKNQPLAGAIQSDPLKIKKLSQPAPPPVAVKEIEDAMEKLKYSGFTSYLGEMKAHSVGCSTKSYSVQDQQTAGCKGNDTVEQCTEKLYDDCMSKGYPGKMQFREAAKHQLGLDLKLAERVQAYANYVDYVLHFYGE